MNSFSKHIKIDRVQRSYIRFNITPPKAEVTDNVRVSQENADTNYFENNLLVCSDWDAARDFFSFIKIDLATITTPVDQAILSLRTRSYFNDDEEPITNVLRVKELATLEETEDWDEETITWNNMPNRDVSLGGGIDFSLPLPDLTPSTEFSLDVTVEINVTSIINNYINDGQSSATLVLQRSQGSIIFWSSYQQEHEKPKITIT